MIIFLLRCKALLPGYCSFFLLILFVSLQSQAATNASISLGYGEDAAQHVDVYLPESPVNAPVLMLINGDSWQKSGKDLRGVLNKKLAYWLPQGFIVISVNYRLLPDANPLAQAQDIAKALAYVQQKINKWGGNPDKIILMGHASGGHLVALLSAAPANFQTQAIKAWRGSVILDSSALDVPAIMNNKPARTYSQAFGVDENNWAATSPLHQLKRNGIPMLVVCSTRRDDACPQAEKFGKEAEKFAVSVQIQREDLSQRGISNNLADGEAYTEAVNIFINNQLQKKTP